MAVFKDMACEFCGKTHPYVSSNALGIYCPDCLRIIIAECENSIDEIMEAKEIEWANQKITETV